MNWSLWQKILITKLCANAALPVKLNNSTLLGWGLSIKSLERAKTGYKELLIVTIMISTPIYLTSVLLLFQHSTRYWLFSKNIILDLVSLVPLKSLRFLSFVLIYVNSLMHKNPNYAILNVVSILRLWNN